MDVKKAVQIAAEYVADMEAPFQGFVAEGSSNDFLQQSNFAIEGAHFSQSSSNWLIDVGFVRPWDKARVSALSGISGAPSSNADKRTYKQVTVSDETEEVVSYGPSDNC